MYLGDYKMQDGESSTIGTKKKVDGIQYIKSANGKWKPLWSEKQKIKATRLYNRGKGYRDIAKEFGVCHSIVKNLLATIPRKSNRQKSRRHLVKKVFKENLSLIKEEASRGASLKDICQICDDYCMWSKTVKDLLTEHNIKLDRDAAYLNAGRARGGAIARKTIARLLNTKPDNVHVYRKNIRALTYLIVRYVSADIYYELNWMRRKNPQERYSIDHCYPIQHGWYKSDGSERTKKLSLAVMCHPENLQVLTLKQNSEKGIKKPFNVKTLMKRIKDFEKNIKPFGISTMKNKYYEI